jgi:predicted N-acetyltransferase YhbS
MNIDYAQEPELSPLEFKQILIESSLGERRPIDDEERLSYMVKNANLIITARYKGKLVGVARSITDFVYATYLSDLAVSKTYQKMGIGKELIRRTKIATLPTRVILLSAPAAVEYYPKIGMKPHPYCFILDNPEDII